MNFMIGLAVFLLVLMTICIYIVDRNAKKVQKRIDELYLQASKLAMDMSVFERNLIGLKEQIIEIRELPSVVYDDDLK